MSLQKSRFSGKSFSFFKILEIPKKKKLTLKNSLKGEQDVKSVWFANVRPQASVRDMVKFVAMQVILALPERAFYDDAALETAIVLYRPPADRLPVSNSQREEPWMVGALHDSFVDGEQNLVTFPQGGGTCISIKVNLKKVFQKFHQKNLRIFTSGNLQVSKKRVC